MKNIKKLTAVALVLALTMASLTLSFGHAAAYEDASVGASADSTVPTGTVAGTPVEDNTGSTNHCLDWSMYTLRGRSNYCPDTPDRDGWSYCLDYVDFLAPEDLEIVRFRFDLYREDPAITIKDYEFPGAATYTLGDSMVMLSGSFAADEPVSVKKGEVLLHTLIEFSVEDMDDFNPSGYTGVTATVHLEVTELVVRTATGTRTIIGDTPAEGTTVDPTGHCTDTNYCAYSNISNERTEGVCAFGEERVISFSAPEDLEIVAFQFALHRESPNVKLQSYTAFTNQMLFNPEPENEITCLMGSVTSLDPFIVEKGTPLLTVTIQCLDDFSNTICLEVEDLSVMTPEGEKLLFQNGVRVSDDPVSPTAATTVSAGDPLLYNIFSNYADWPDNFETTDRSDRPMTFKAPEDLEIVSFECVFVMSGDDHFPGEIISAQCFSDDAIFDVQPLYHTVVVNCNVSNADTPYSVKEGDALFRAVIRPDSTVEQIDLDLEVTNLVVRTPNGDKRLLPEVPDPIDDPDETTTPGEGEEDNTASTNHCEDWSLYRLVGRSNYCPDTPDRTGSSYCCDDVDFLAPEDLEIVFFGFELYRDDPAVTVEDYELPASATCTAGDSMVMLSGSFTADKPVSVKKGDVLLHTLIEFRVEDMESCNPGDPGESSGVTTTVYLKVTDLVVQTATGLRTVIGDKPGELVIGDVNRNGVLDVDDATMIQRHLAEYTNADGSPIIDELADFSFFIADVDRNGKITVGDVTAIQRKLAEFST